MNIQTIQEGLALLGATLTVDEEKLEATIKMNGITVTLNLEHSSSQIETAFCFLNLNIVHWFKIIKEAVVEEIDKVDKGYTSEIIELFNKTFEGKLPPIIRATEYTLRKLDQCISLYGRESVDEVFAQVLSEPFMLGETESEFRATFQYIFEPDVFKSILLRSRKEKGGKTC